MVRGSSGHYCFVTILLHEITGAKAKPGGDVMELHGKKGTFFITGEVFPLDKDLLMGAVCPSFLLNSYTTISWVDDQRRKAPQHCNRRAFLVEGISNPTDTFHTRGP